MPTHRKLIAECNGDKKAAKKRFKNYRQFLKDKNNGNHADEWNLSQVSNSSEDTIDSQATLMNRIIEADNCIRAIDEQKKRIEEEMNKNIGQSNNGDNNNNGGGNK